MSTQIEPAQPQLIFQELLKLKAQEEEQTNRIGQAKAEEWKGQRSLEGQIESINRQKKEAEVRHFKEIHFLESELLKTTNQKNQYLRQLYNFYLQERSETIRRIIGQTGDKELIEMMERDQHSQELEKLLGERTDGYEVHLSGSEMYIFNRAIDNLLRTPCPFLTGKRDERGVPHYTLSGKEVIVVAPVFKSVYSRVLTEEQGPRQKQPWKYTQDVFIRDWYDSPQGSGGWLILFYQEPSSTEGLEVLGFLLQQEIAHLLREEEAKENAERGE